MDAVERRKHLNDYFDNNKFVSSKNNSYVPRDSDIICVGPPKSGTTWMQQILHQIRTKGDMSFQDIYDVTVNIFHPDTKVEYDVNKEQVCNPRIFKHHESYGIIPTTEKQKTIFIARNPYDAAYSWSKFIDRFLGGDKDISDHDMAEMLITNHNDNKCPNFKNIASWWERKNNPNILFVFYEDLKKELSFMIRKIAHFVELPLTGAELTTVVHNCSFEYMAKNKDKFQGETMILAIATSAGLQNWQPSMGMVREDGGKIGEGFGNLGPELKETVERLWMETMEKQFGFENYQEMYGQNSCLTYNPLYFRFS